MEYSGCWNGIAMVASGIVAALTAVALARRLFSADALRLAHDATGNVLAVVGTLYAVLLGLVVVDATTHVGSLHDFEPRTEAEKTIYPNVLEEIEQLWDRRRERASMAEYGIPIVEWMSLILGGGVTMFFAGLFSVGNQRLQIVITTLAALVISLNLYVVCLLAYPFAGELSVSKRPFELDLAVFSGVYDDRPAHEGEEHAPVTITP